MACLPISNYVLKNKTTEIDTSKREEIQSAFHTSSKRIIGDCVQQLQANPALPLTTILDTLAPFRNELATKNPLNGEANISCLFGLPRTTGGGCAPLFLNSFLIPQDGVYYSSQRFLTSVFQGLLSEASPSKETVMESKKGVLKEIFRKENTYLDISTELRGEIFSAEAFFASHQDDLLTFSRDSVISGCANGTSRYDAKWISFLERASRAKPDVYKAWEMFENIFFYESQARMVENPDKVVYLKGKTVLLVTASMKFPIGDAGSERLETTRYFVPLSENKKGKLYLADPQDTVIMVVPQDALLIKKTKAVCEKLFKEIVNWDRRELDSLKEKMGILRYALTQGNFYERGSAAISEWVESIGYNLHGVHYAYLKDEPADLKAFENPLLENFMAWYKKNVVVLYPRENPQPV